MKKELSKYLQEVKPSLKVLLNELLKEYTYVSILASDSKGKTYNVSRSGTTISVNSMTNERGFVVRVYDGTGYSEYSFNEINESLIPKIVETIKNDLVPLRGKLTNIVTETKYEKLEEEEIKFSKSSEYEVDPSELGDKEIVEVLTEISEKARLVDERIIDCRVHFEYLHLSKIFLSEKKDLEQSILWSNGMEMPMARKDAEVKYTYKTFSVQGGAELLDQMKHGVEDAVKVTLELLDSTPITPGEYDVICDPDVTGLIAHEAFGHGVEMDMFVKDRALASKYIDKEVASSLVTMHDGASAAAQTGSFYFDDEGSLAKDTIIIDKGILKQGICDSQAAMYLGTKPTGNGRRQNYERKAYTRMTNTFFETGTNTVEEMISSIDYGFFLENSMNGMEDPKNWGIQCMVNIAREIKGGRFTGKVFSPVVLTGYVPDLLKSISMVSTDMELSGTGFCGKGYKEWVKVSTGGPAIKARVKLG
ncbi:TldD/PmbA family protein [Anaeromicropila herbilytica]|uniref:Zn-dependent protease n=1 Tax=Anaeromicropila herbilytica TaxID=2785025 RepID=A0A7R7ELT5_9FIRM|nr:TldD/PmbA family protein [Anaeromicropila herbilytica]BCN31179.1 Zn-dependent protease [Anaeromicropila herbilytica]